MSSKKRPTSTNEESGPSLLPKLRFPEFREADGWNATPLGELGAIVTGKTPSTKEDDLWGGEILFITPTDITEEEKYQHTTQRTVIETKGTKVLPPGSVVYTCIASIGKMALTVVPSVTNQQINAVVPNGKTAREFIYYSLANLTPWIKSIPATSTLPIINKTQFSGFIIPHPEDNAEQQKIAECLSSLDELIAAQARKVDALKTHKKGLVQQLFPREGETQPRLRFPEFRDAGEWRRETLGSLCARIMDGTHFSPKSKEGPRPYLTSKNIKDGRIDLSNLSYISEEEHTEIYNKCPVKPRDVLLTKDGANTGNCALNNLDFEFSLLSSVAVLRGQENKLCQDFLFQSILSDSIQSLITESMSGQAITRITLAKIGRFTISVTSPAEQQRIAKCLSSLDALIAGETNKLEALKTHKKGLMQQLFPSTEVLTTL